MNEYEVFFAPEARDDLLNLFDWIANAASPDTALSYIERIEAHCLGLKHVAERGHRRDDIRPGLRILGFERRITIALNQTGFAGDVGVRHSAAILAVSSAL